MAPQRLLSAEDLPNLRLIMQALPLPGATEVTAGGAEIIITGGPHERLKIAPRVAVVVAAAVTNGNSSLEGEEGEDQFTDTTASLTLRVPTLASTKRTWQRSSNRSSKLRRARDGPQRMATPMSLSWRRRRRGFLGTRKGNTLRRKCTTARKVSLTILLASPTAVEPTGLDGRHVTRSVR